MVSLYDILRGDVIPLSGINVSIGRNTYDGAAPAVPINDLHLRSLNLYDASTSGTLTYNNTDKRIDLIRTPKETYPIVTAVFFQVVDTVGGQTITTDTPIIFDATPTYNTHPNIFVWNGSDQLSLGAGGVYLVSWSVTLSPNSTAKASSFSVRLMIDNGSGYTEEPGTICYANESFDYKVEATPVTISKSFLITCPPSLSSITLYATDNTTGRSVQKINGSSLTVQKVY
jgi:hypothetical protein